MLTYTIRGIKRANDKCCLQAVVSCGVLALRWDVMVYIYMNVDWIYWPYKYYTPTSADIFTTITSTNTRLSAIVNVITMLHPYTAHVSVFQNDAAAHVSW